MGWPNSRVAPAASSAGRSPHSANSTRPKRITASPAHSRSLFTQFAVPVSCVAFDPGHSELSLRSLTASQSARPERCPPRQSKESARELNPSRWTARRSRTENSPPKNGVVCGPHAGRECGLSLVPAAWRVSLHPSGAGFGRRGLRTACFTERRPLNTLVVPSNDKRRPRSFTRLSRARHFSGDVHSGSRGLPIDAR